MRGLRVLLLGQGRLEFDGQPLTRLMAAKHQALVFYLAATGEPAPRNRLAALLWGELDEAAARANLRVALTRLRRWLPGVLDIDERTVAFAADVPVSVDWQEVTAALRDDAPPAAREAAALAWRGPLLDGLDVAGSDAFEHWLAQVRQRAQRDAVALRRALMQRQEADGALDTAITHARGLLEIDDADEPAHMALMRLLAARGQRTAALHQYGACRAALAERLGARPSAECYALYTHIHAETAAPGTAAVAPVPDDEARPAPARAQAPAEDQTRCPDRPANGALFGRASELALLTECLADPECRWVTITGPGGVGKTRLAEAAAADLATRFRHGALWFSGRDAGGALRDAEALAQQVLERVGADRHAHGALLLLLDNLETVAGARALATLLAQRVPGAVVLATSRARVGGAREWLVELTGLSLARASDGAPASSPAAQLFAASARRLVPGFSAAAEADAVERICTCVGGLPLALQMAARAVHSAGTAAVADRLGSSTSLTDPDRDADDRHHSIELVLEDSWALLDEPTRAAALRLAWLPAEADAGLARAIGVGDAALATLRDHSWLQRSGSARFALHPLQQDFLRRRPLAGSQATEVRSAVARHLREAMPAVPPFGDVRGTDAAHATTLAGSAAGAAPVIADAAAQCCAEAKLDALVPWIDSAVALLQHADRQSEAAALLAQALLRADLPSWLSTGWGLRRAELLSAEGAATASLRGYSQALGEFGLGEVAPGGKAWLAMPSAIARLLARRDWPAPGLSRTGFEALLLRSLYFSTIYLTFSPGPMPAARLAALADVLARRLRGHADLRRLMAGWGLATFGHPVLAGLQERRTSPPGRPKGEYRSAQHEGTPVSAARKPSADLPLEALYTEGQCALRMTLGRWGGLGAAFDDAAARWAALRNVRHEMGMRSLGAKLALYEGRLAEAYDRFAEVSELSLQRPGETWRAWGPMGQAETALCLGRLDDAALQRLYERASQVMTEMEDVDSAYTLRRLGLAARLAWRRGDVNAAREAVLAGCAAAARLTYCSFWSHEGYVGLGDMLLALRRHERERGGASPPLDAGWAQLEPALQAHVRRFPPAAALFERLRGQHALDDGSVAAATSALRRAVGLSERQGMRVELARACQALADIDTKGPWRERAARLSHDLGLQPASRGAGDPVGRASA